MTPLRLSRRVGAQGFFPTNSLHRGCGDGEEKLFNELTFRGSPWGNFESAQSPAPSPPQRMSVVSVTDNFWAATCFQLGKHPSQSSQKAAYPTRDVEPEPAGW